MEDNKYDIRDEGDLGFSEELRKWVPKEELIDIEYEKELDADHRIPKINLAD